MKSLPPGVTTRDIHVGARLNKIYSRVGIGILNSNGNTLDEKGKAKESLPFLFGGSAPGPPGFSALKTDV